MSKKRTCDDAFISENCDNVISNDRNDWFECHEGGCDGARLCMAEFEMHFAMHHTHMCQECEKTFEENQLLALHFDEFHNPFWNGTFSCFKADCRSVFATSAERVEHLVISHNYPRAYDFDAVNSRSNNRN